MVNGTALDIYVFPRPGEFRARVEAHSGGRRVHVDSFDPTSGFSRQKFIAVLREKGVVPDGIDLDAAIVKRADEASQEALDGAAPKIRPEPVGSLIAAHKHLREPVINGVLRRGETANVIAAPKVGKSWLAYHTLLCVATGQDWLGRFPCVTGRVLLIDNELHPETLAHRIPAVAEAMQLQPSDYQGVFEVLSLRGRLADLYAIERFLEAIEPGEFDLVVLDAWYRAMPGGISENDNQHVAGLYNVIDAVAARLDCAWLNIHHASKGQQGGKAVTDVGSGAGSQSRAADAHIVLRPHEEPDCAVMEAALRSWAPIEPLPLRWVFPLWWPDPLLDPAALKGAKPANQERQEAKDREGMDELRNALRQGPATIRELRRLCGGMGKARCERLVDRLESLGEVESEAVTVRGNECREYHLTNPL